ncbi:hypothetical protein BH09MYX1_BH09MYX1_52530 [soil metagenome]
MARSRLFRLASSPLLRPVPFALALAYAGVRGRAMAPPLADDRSSALVFALAQKGTLVTNDDVKWLDGPSGVRGALFGHARALVRGHAEGEPCDLYIVEARLSPEGVLLDLGSVYDLTRTNAVDEDRPTIHGSVIAYVASAGDVRTSVHVIDLEGRDAALYTDFTRTQRFQTEVTNLQATGQKQGIVHHVFSLDPVADTVTLSFRDDGMLAVRADDRALVLDPKTPAALEGSGWVRVTADTTKARPGNLVTWSVDRVRAMPWFGEDNMQVLKVVAFTGLDWALRFKGRFGNDQDTAASVAEDLGDLGHGAKPMFVDPEIGWPPEPMTPIVNPPIGGEGKWIALDDDPFITAANGVPSAFVTSFLRAEKDRATSRVYVTLWDPRQIALHMEAGTVEPLSATGEAGPGLVPRVPEILRKVVGGFNGGFQAVHGEYGMQANGVLYLPPKPYAATVLELRDGTTAFGSWPASTDVPDDVLSYRQNLTALLEHEKFNPWGRTWWGGTPPGWQDNVHTTRSGICLTTEGYVGYFYGTDIAADVLAKTMQSARCTYSIHLDMNPGLVGFEFYSVAPSSMWKPLGRPLQADWEYEGTFKQLPDFHYRARRMIRGMVEQNFPQYIHLDGRDFFYLTRRPILPGQNLGASALPAEANEGTWRTKGLPQHGFPYAIALTDLRASLARPDARLHVVKLDPRTLRTAGSPGTTETTPTIAVFTDQPSPKTGQRSLRFTSSGTFAAEGSDAGLPLALVGPLDTSAPTHAAAGIDDEDGMLVWIEIDEHVAVDEGTRSAMIDVLKRAGCSTRLAVLSSTRVLPGGTLDARGEAAQVPSTGIVARLVRGSTPGARMYYDTPVVSPNTWQPLQSQRVRYFNRPKPQGDGGVEAGSTTPSGTSAGTAGGTPGGPL